jgi:hypothetical protein
MDNERPRGNDTLILPRFPDPARADRIAGQRLLARAAAGLLVHVGLPTLPTNILKEHCHALQEHSPLPRPAQWQHPP